MAKAVKKVIPSILKPVLDQRGFAQAQIILDWEKIVGLQMAQYGVPERIIYYKNAKTRGTLVLAVTPGWAPVITHGMQQIIERINSYFGYEAVNRLQLKQTLYKQSQTSSPMDPQQTLPAQVEDLIEIADPALRQAMARLKQSLGSI